MTRSDKSNVRFPIARDWLRRPVYRLRVWRLKRKLAPVLAKSREQNSEWPS